MATPIPIAAIAAIARRSVNSAGGFIGMERYATARWLVALAGPHDWPTATSHVAAPAPLPPRGGHRGALPAMTIAPWPGGSGASETAVLPAQNKVPAIAG